MTENSQGKELQERASLLQSKLAEFVTKNTFEREKMLRELFQMAKVKEGVVIPEVLSVLVDPEFQPKLQLAVEKAAKTRFYVGKEKVNPWLGGYTVIAIGMDGKIKGASTNPIGLVYEKFGKNEYGQAFKQALARLHRELSGKDGDLGKEENRVYFKRLGIIFGKDIYKGDAKTEFPVVSGETSTNLVIGTTGCEATDEYRNGVGQKMLISDEEVGIKFMAGVLASTFAKNVATYLGNPSLTEEVVAEPLAISLFRTAN